MAELGFEDQLRQIIYPLRIQNAVQVIAFMLHDTRVEAVCLSLDALPVQTEAAVTNVRGTPDKST